MNSEEQTLIDGLFTRLQQAEMDAAPRDVQAQERINQHLARQPAAAYYMTQAILVQEAALKQARAAPAPAPASGGFLSGMFGGSNRPAAPAPAPAASGGWRDGPSSPPPAPAYSAAQAAAPVAPAAGSSFLGGALKTAAGVAGGVMLAQGISSLFSHNQQPQVVEEIIEQPVPASDSGWGSGNQQFANNDGPGIEDVGLDDDDFFSDDDSFV